MKIHVRRRHIEAGEPGDAETCPIALACNEAGISHCRIYWRLAYSGPLLNPVIYSLPRKAQRFVERFDAGKPVKPFAFVLK